jgi:hypothetical protein
MVASDSKLTSTLSTRRLREDFVKNKYTFHLMYWQCGRKSRSILINYMYLLIHILCVGMLVRLCGHLQDAM